MEKPDRGPQEMEAFAARASREYHENVRGAPGLSERRDRLAEFVSWFYSDRLKIDLSDHQKQVFEALADPETLAMEIAHDGQLPHLGVVRMVLKTHDVSTIDGRAVTLYLVGDHYSPEMRPDNIHFGMPLRGKTPDEVKHPPKLRIGKANVHKPFRWLPPPTPANLRSLQNQLAEFISHNVAHERKSGHRIAEEVREEILARLQDIFKVLESASQCVQNMGDWLIRVQHDMFHRMLAIEADAILFLPMAGLTGLFKEELVAMVREADVIAEIKEAVSEEQRIAGREPYQRSRERSHFWIYCPACGRRSRYAWSPGQPYAHVCPVCGGHTSIDPGRVWDQSMPDIVVFELGLFRFGVDGWVVGSEAPYHPVIERAHRALFGSEMPPRYLLDSVPRFCGLGDPPEGYGKARLLRVLLEMRPERIGAALRAPWTQNPSLRSEFLSE